MTQHPIDLMPPSVRARSLAGIRAGHYVIALVMSLLLIIVTTTHLRLTSRNAQARLRQAHDAADHALEVEREVKRLGVKLDSFEESIIRYERVAAPIEVSQVVATLVRVLPDDVMLDRVQIDAGLRGSQRRRVAIDESGEAPRILVGELAGFAPTDSDVADYVGDLSRPPFTRVDVDFTGPRTVRGHEAREYRISFEIDLSQRYSTRVVALPEEETTP